ncbi:MAG: CoA ester lyase [Anaerolineaceae bacterium]|jgi:citrate lyase beta subunit|nr:MAG: CoA ester lyase [Anaerolineaceae bacterium]
MRLRRAFLYTPADDLHKIEKACTLKADCVCLDLEDAVSLSKKDEARLTAAHALGTFDFGRSERLVRINAPSTPTFMPDLRTVVDAIPDGIVIPKIENAGTLQYVDGFLEAYEIKSEMQIGSIRLIAIIETARSFVNLREICEVTPRLDALIFGAEDLAVSLGARRTASNREVFFARSQMVLYAAASGLDAIDLVCNNYHDPAVVYEEALEGAQLGYCGKQVIHPNQIEVVQRAFSPTQEEIEKARRIVAEYELLLGNGKGALGLRGELVDMPVYRQAKQLIEKADLIAAW